MFYYYDLSGNVSFIIPTISGGLNYFFSGLIPYNPNKKTTLSGLITYTGVSGAVSYIQTISGLFSGFNNFYGNFQFLTLSSYDK